ncbi:MAG TPA: tetraacyldisaccharide 4'-kinase, partial [bacterium]|nr:tetraacyldisaccharide 4'-kinase [bacterium]
MDVIDLRKWRPLSEVVPSRQRAFLALLAPLGALYGAGVGLWRWLPARPVRLGVPVVSVGSIMVGGTGKTPISMLVARWLLDSGRRVCIISRGYRRKSGRSPLVVSDGRSLLVGIAESGDEPYLMAERLPGVMVVVGRDRVEAAQHALRVFKPEVFVLDDGFQARKLAKDAEIVTLDSEAIRSRQAMLPVGRMREGWSALRRGHLVVVLLGANDPVPDASWLTRFTSGKVCWASRGEARIFDAEGKPVQPEMAKKAACLLVSGVAAPAGFERTCLLAGIDARASVRFDDHHWYDDGDAARISDMMAACGCTRLVTTEKDSPKLPGSLKSLAWIVRADVALKDG